VVANLSATTVAHPTVVSIGGAVTPFVAGQTLERETYYSHAWHVRSLARVGPHGRFRFTVRELIPRVQTTRIVAMAMGNRGAGYSAVLKLTVT
jgi:hypothetical protein